MNNNATNQIVLNPLKIVEEESNSKVELYNDMIRELNGIVYDCIEDGDQKPPNIDG